MVFPCFVRPVDRRTGLARPSGGHVYGPAEEGEGPLHCFMLISVERYVRAKWWLKKWTNMMENDGKIFFYVTNNVYYVLIKIHEKTINHSKKWCVDSMENFSKKTDNRGTMEVAHVDRGFAHQGAVEPGVPAPNVNSARFPPWFERKGFG